MPIKTANRRFARIECRVLQRQQHTAPMRSAPVAGAARLGIRATAVMSCSSRAASGLTAASWRTSPIRGPGNDRNSSQFLAWEAT